MVQNTSSAVMQQRHEPHDSLDDFPTPPWATRALVHKVLIGGGWRQEQLATTSSREPACNRGFMARPMAESFASVEATDIFDYGYGGLADYLSIGRQKPVDWTICNPPFKLGMEFVKRALETSRVGVAMFVRSSFYEGVTRYNELFAPYKPTFYAPFAERVVLTKGRLLDPDKLYPFENRKTGEIEMRKPSTATSYAWFVWATEDHHHCAGRTEVRHIPPCRKELTRPGDYDGGEG